jgi:phosphate transport system protein
MPRADFDLHLSKLQDDLLLLGSMVEKAITKALDGLKQRNPVISEEVIKNDDLIDSKSFELEDTCIDLIARQQPLARDLRFIVTVLHLSVELERMGDYAEGIAKISLAMGDQPPLKPLIDIPLMANKATEMVNQSLNALVKRDSVLATRVCNDDDAVDELYDKVYQELLTYMIRDPEAIQRATYLLWVAHDIERIADRATNIAERVIFLVTGKMTDVNVSKY